MIEQQNLFYNQQNNPRYVYRQASPKTVHEYFSQTQKFTKKEDHNKSSLNSMFQQETGMFNSDLRKLKKYHMLGDQQKNIETFLQQNTLKERLQSENNKKVLKALVNQMVGGKFNKVKVAKKESDQNIAQGFRNKFSKQKLENVQIITHQSLSNILMQRQNDMEMSLKLNDSYIDRKRIIEKNQLTKEERILNKHQQISQSWSNLKAQMNKTLHRRLQDQSILEKAEQHRYKQEIYDSLQILNQQTENMGEDYWACNLRKCQKKQDQIDQNVQKRPPWVGINDSVNNYRIRDIPSGFFNDRCSSLKESLEKIRNPYVKYKPLKKIIPNEYVGQALQDNQKDIEQFQVNTDDFENLLIIGESQWQREKKFVENLERPNDYHLKQNEPFQKEIFLVKNYDISQRIRQGFLRTPKFIQN